MLIEISPKGTYLVTYNSEDNSIVSWNIGNVENVEDEGQLKPDYLYTIDHKYTDMSNICISDDKKLAYIYNGFMKIIDMNNNGQEIELIFNKNNYYSNYYCIFNLKGEFILNNKISNFAYEDYSIIWIYSTQTKNRKWTYKRIYKIPEGYELISISKYDKLYLLFSNNYIHEWDLLTEKSIRMFGNKEKIELEIPIVTLDANNVYTKIDKEKQQTETPEIQQQTVETPLKTKEQINVQTFNYIDLYNISLPLLNSEICNFMLDYLKKNHQLSAKEYQTSLSKITQNVTTKYVFRILDEYFLKIKLPKMDSSFKINKETYKHLNVHSFNLYMVDPHAFLQDYLNNLDKIDHKEFEWANDSIK
ncbi:hypothetical protein C1645_840737 [Glomus cerebriforme]|uniref:Uncharacterized protein n=1 Tax=Glomus cerebriforme TaxID=658196 RepID=A0A397S609_9GLOM|nr:hypothetical protein C1645_840737 [Glomus cerebriforme]